VTRFRALIRRTVTAAHTWRVEHPEAVLALADLLLEVWPVLFRG
jgi:hypothetical protein